MIINILAKCYKIAGPDIAKGLISQYTQLWTLQHSLLGSQLIIYIYTYDLCMTNHCIWYIVFGCIIFAFTFNRHTYTCNLYLIQIFKLNKLQFHIIIFCLIKVNKFIKKTKSGSFCDLFEFCYNL